MIRPDILVSAIIGILTVVGSIIAVRFQNRSAKEVAEVSTEVEQRKVDQATFDRNVALMEKRLAHITHQMDQLSGLVAVSFRHIGDLRSSWPPEKIHARPPVPVELRNRVPTWYLDEGVHDESQ